MKTENFQAEGTITGCHANYRFSVTLDCGSVVLAHLCGRMIKHFIRCTTGDAVVVEVGAYDPSRGRIVKRID